MKRWGTLVVACWMAAAACGGGSSGPGVTGTELGTDDTALGETDVTVPEDARQDGPAESATDLAPDLAPDPGEGTTVDADATPGEDPAGEATPDEGAEPAAEPVPDVPVDVPADIAPDPAADPAGDPAGEVATDATAEAEVPPCKGNACVVCKPCLVDLDCTVDGGVGCVDEGNGGSFCAFPCTTDEECPKGFECPFATNPRHCTPAGTEACSCLPQFAGMTQNCYRHNDFGTCQGVAACGQACPAQEPMQESCNGLDDNCNGQTDEEGALGCQTWYLDVDGDTYGLASKSKCLCAASGLYRTQVAGDCNDADKSVHPGGTEICNGKDDDCNGQIDEGLGTTTCGLGPCQVTVPACFQGTPQVCTPKAPGIEICNGIDDNCDGEIDNGLAPLTCGIGACFNSVPSCVDGKPQTCTPLPPTAEICNGIDDNCDGVTDENLPPATCGTGICANSVPSCLGGVPQVCTPKAPQTEVCNGLDDNCDGNTDETGCPCPVKSYGGHTYEFCTPQGHWDVARDACTAHGPGYHLVTINNAAENAWLSATAAGYAGGAWWAGFNDRSKEGSWVWVDGETPGYTNWNSGEPSNSNFNEDCLVLNDVANGKWNDTDCNDSDPFICEHE